MKELLRVAALMGVSVHGAYLEPGVMGEYYADEREIYFDLRLAPFEQMETIAHELGHAHHNHRCEGDRRAEDQADVFAARLLVDPEAFARMEGAGLDLQDIADELGVSIDTVHVFMQHCLTKLRGVTYATSKMGAAQWRFRGAAAAS